MADLGIWFKLWVSALDDDSLDSLDIADFGRWAKFGTHVKAQGTGGVIALSPPCRTLCAKLQVADFDALIDAIARFPHVQMRRDTSSVSGETITHVSFHNWQKYQGDFSTHRVRHWREMKRSKRRGEETRRDEKRKEDKEPPIVPQGTFRSEAVEVLTFLNHKTGRNFQPRDNLHFIVDRLKAGATVDQCRAIIGLKTAKWQGTEMAMYLRPATLFNKTKFAQYLGELPASAFEAEGPDHV